jgi:hypothetical protein
VDSKECDEVELHTEWVVGWFGCEVKQGAKRW